MPDLIKFEGNLKENDLLTRSNYIGHKRLRGPETIVFSADGSMYTGLMNGQIVRINLQTQEITKIVQIGNESNETVCSEY